MKNLPQKQISPSFAFKDIYVMHRLMVWAGITICIGGIIAMFLSLNSWRYLSSTQSIVESVNMSLPDFVNKNNDENSPMATSILPSASKLGRHLSSRLNIEKPFLIIGGDVQLNVFSNISAGFIQQLSDNQVLSKNVESLQLSLMNIHPKLVAINRKHFSSKKIIPTSQSGANYINSLNQLSLISSNPHGVGIEHVNALEFDILTLVNGVRNLTEFNGIVDLNLLYSEALSIQKEMQQSLASIKSMNTSETALNKIKDSIKQLSRSSIEINSPLAKLISTNFLVIIFSVVLIVVGILMMIFGLILAMADFEVRYHRSASQFRRNEKSIMTILDSFTKLSEGDLAVEIPNFEDVQLSTLSNKINDFLINIRDALHKILESSERAKLAGNNSKNETVQATVISGKQSHELSELKSFNEISLHEEFICGVDLSGLKYSGQLAIESIQSGSRSLLDAAENLEGLRENIHTSSKRMKKLGERSQEAESIVDSLSVFSEKISILALNAALEADRAGEQGSGFAIIAAEIRKLSAQTERTIADISDNIQNFQADTREAINNMEGITHKVLRSSQIADMALASMLSIRVLTESMLGMIDEINSTRKQRSKNFEKTSLKLSMLLENSLAIKMQLDKSMNEITNSLHQVESIQSVSNTQFE